MNGIEEIGKSLKATEDAFKYMKNMSGINKDLSYLRSAAASLYDAVERFAATEQAQSDYCRNQLAQTLQKIQLK